MVTSKNETSTPIYFATNILSIMINSASDQEPWSDPATQVGFYNILSNVLLNDNYYS